MSLPRMTPRDGIAWVTGASSGIGAAVALELARRGWTVAATARRLDELEALARKAETLAGRIVAHQGDVTDKETMDALVDGIETVHGPIALAFLNAGVAPYTRAGSLDVEAFEKALGVNTLGIVKALAPVLRRMKDRGRGQVAVTASIAGFGGLPKASAYGASKAAAIHLCEALKFDCDLMGVRLQVVNPGFIDTPLTKTNDFPMPFLMEPDDAARRTVDGFESGGFQITYPKRLYWLVRLVNLLPYGLYFRAIAKATNWKEKGGDGADHGSPRHR